uniref:Acyl-CoA thioesterase 4 n=1 Tax=Macaca mulatta TaxID=9544 RepID=A0A5F8ASZ6_MACMU
MSATLILEPPGRCCWNEPVRIAVRGLAPEQRVTLRASLRDEKGALFRAHARYCADARGELDLEHAPALGGSFAGLEPMGLLWALEPEKPFWRFLKRDVEIPFVVELEVLDGHDPEPGRLLCQARHERLFLPPGVRRESVRAGRVRATLFLPPGPGPFPGIIDIFGIGGGLLEYRASLLAGHGFATLALAYYNFEDLPKNMDNISLEYFEEALCYMLQHPQVKGPGIGLLGISLGADICLSMASFLKNVSATVSINGSGISGNKAINYKLSSIPPLGYDLRRIKVRMAATLILEPAGRCCWDEPVLITVRGLAPEQRVTLRASLHDEKGALFRAHARYRADARGELDLERAPALGGSFAGLEPMGLLWALEPEKALVRLVKRDVRTPFAVELEVLDGHGPEPGRLLCRAQNKRDFLQPGVRREPVRAGRVRAALFLPPGE